MRRYIDNNGKKVVEIDDLSYLKDHDHHYNWFQRHWRHHRIRLAVKNADIVVVPDQETAIDAARYYFIPKERILINPLS